MCAPPVLCRPAHQPSLHAPETPPVHLPISLPLQRLSSQIRQAIREQRYPEFVRQYVARQFPAGDVPEWVCEGCRLAGISLEGVAKEAAANGPATAAAAADGAAVAEGQQQQQQQQGTER